MIKWTIFIQSCADTNLRKLIDNIFDDKMSEYELIISTDESIHVPLDEDERIKLVSPNAQLDEISSEIRGEYVLICDDNIKLNSTYLNNIYTVVDDNHIDLALLKQEGRCYNIFNRDFADISEDNLDALLKCRNVLYLDEEKINRNTLMNYEDLINEFITFQDLLLKLHSEDETKILNNKIDGLITIYNQTSIEYKMKVFLKIKEEFVKILMDEHVEIIINQLTRKNRKLFEQIIISENVEEYELLIKVTENNHSIDEIINEEKELENHNKEIVELNEEMLSSKSWKLTKFLRIKDKINL